MRTARALLTTLVWVPFAEAAHYSLPATPDNAQWGWYDTSEKPRLTVNSGNTVSIETISHSLGQIKPDADMDKIVKLRKENDGGDCRVTQVVDIRKGVHCMIPKHVFVDYKAAARPHDRS